MTQVSNAFQGAVVLYTSGNFIQKRMAYRIAKAISAASGVEVTFGKEKTRRCAAKLVMKDDKKLTAGDWRITVKGKTATFAAGSYYGYYGIMQFLSTEAASDFYALPDGYVKEGNYRDTIDLEPNKASCRYAYDKRGDVRLMYYNVLFGIYTGMRKREDGRTMRDVPPPDRNPLQLEMIRQYRPDVLGCQEFDASKRGMCSGKYNALDALLEQEGYRESCPRDTSLHPYFNNTPIFYNPKTTKLIKSQYYWYENQLDAENMNNCAAMDSASKAATWGVFEDRKTGKRYIFVNTHMCTRSDNVRGLQAQEAVKLISSLVEKYNAPVFLGGDFNGGLRSANYRYFKGENAGYLDVLYDELATEFSIGITPHHTYPCYHAELGFMLPDAKDSFSDPAWAHVDHIMLTNADDVKVGVYGVVVDECTMSSSDHYPIFADVTL